MNTDYLLLIVIGVMLIAPAVLYGIMPDTMPVHWGPSGAADGFAGKGWGLFAIPVITVFVYGVFLVIPQIAVFKENFREFRKEYQVLKAILVLFFAALYVATLLYSIKPFNMNYAIIPLVSALLYGVGMLMPRFKRNFFVGIKTPWTLADERVWNKTHAVGGKVFKATAVVILVGGILLLDKIVWVLLASVLGATAIVTVYSFLEYRRYHSTK
ncbi:MAG: SdpI family protein [Candidatus Diapherotrites archaeon]|nr:SdpI family protein [Candidatus Diapherotrites archaeon]